MTPASCRMPPFGRRQCARRHSASDASNLSLLICPTGVRLVNVNQLKAGCLGAACGGSRPAPPRIWSSPPAFLLLPFGVFLARPLAVHHWCHDTPRDPEALSRDYSAFPPSGHLAFDVPAYISWRMRMRNHAGLHPVPYLASSKTTPVSVKLWESPGLAGGLPLLLMGAPLPPRSHPSSFTSISELTARNHSTYDPTNLCTLRHIFLPSLSRNCA